MRHGFGTKPTYLAILDTCGVLTVNFLRICTYKTLRWQSLILTKVTGFMTISKCDTFLLISVPLSISRSANRKNIRRYR